MNKLARFAVTPQFLCDLMKHGIGSAKIVDGPLPPDARVHGCYVQDALIWVIVESESFQPVEPAAVIPELTRTVFTKDTPMQRALDIINWNWDTWVKETAFEQCSQVPHVDVVELIARIIVDIQSQQTTPTDIRG